MSRLHRRDPRGDWSLEIEWAGFGGSRGMFYARTSRYLLSMAVTRDEAQQLMQSGSRGLVEFIQSYSYSGDVLHARGIEVTEQEVQQVMNGTHPRDVLFDPDPACGYRLRAVPVDFSQLGAR